MSLTKLLRCFVSGERRAPLLLCDEVEAGGEFRDDHHFAQHAVAMPKSLAFRAKKDLNSSRELTPDRRALASQERTLI
jgi:hypothetical protein